MRRAVRCAEILNASWEFLEAQQVGPSSGNKCSRTASSILSLRSARMPAGNHQRGARALGPELAD
jgi:hypothetical protein